MFVREMRSDSPCGLAVQFDLASVPAPIEHDRLARTRLGQARHELELQTRRLTAAVQGLQEIQTGEIEIADGPALGEG